MKFVVGRFGLFARGDYYLLWGRTLRSGPFKTEAVWFNFPGKINSATRREGVLVMRATQLNTGLWASSLKGDRGHSILKQDIVKISSR